jgi:hypothetical protein
LIEPADDGAVATTVKEALAEGANPLEPNDKVQVVELPPGRDVNAEQVAPLTLLYTKPVGKKSIIVAVVPLAVCPSLVTVNVYVISELTAAVEGPDFDNIRCDGELTVVDAFEQFVVVQLGPGVGAVPFVVVATDA